MTSPGCAWLTAAWMDSPGDTVTLGAAGAGSVAGAPVAAAPPGAAATVPTPTPESVRKSVSAVMVSAFLIPSPFSRFPPPLQPPVGDGPVRGCRDCPSEKARLIRRTVQAGRLATRWRVATRSPLGTSRRLPTHPNPTEGVHGHASSGSTETHD